MQNTDYRQYESHPTSHCSASDTSNVGYIYVHNTKYLQRYKWLTYITSLNTYGL